MSKIILVAETGSDITKEEAKELGIYIVPMYVSMNDETLVDGSFPTEDILEYYHNTHKTPKTSGSSPDDFVQIFAEIHEKHPDAHILHLAYSAVTTCSYQSAIIAGDELDYVTSIDTKQVSFGQRVVVLKVAEKLKNNPDITIEEAVRLAEEMRDKVHMAFIPANLQFLRAGGRVSNAAYMGGTLLGIHPCIEIIDGYLLAKKKYRGSMDRVLKKLLKDFTSSKNLSKKHLYLGHTIGFSDELKKLVESEAANLGYTKFSWSVAHGVITTHGGPGAFAVIGIEE